MRRGTIFIALFILVAAGIIAASRFISSQPPLEVTVAVDPLAEPWLQAAVSAFNASDTVVNGSRRVRVVLTPTDDLRVWLDSRAWTAATHPAAWIPASSVSVRYAVDAGMPFEIVADSLARTPLVWGGFASRVAVLTQDGTQPFDWPTVAAAAQAEAWQKIGGEPAWQFFKLAFAQPTSKMSGLAVMLTGAAAFHDSADLSGEALRTRPFRDWMAPVLQSVPNFSNLGSDPAAVMARQGTAIADVALLPEVDWLRNLGPLRRVEDVVLAYPAYQLVLDFPLARWDDMQTTADERAAVAALATWLLDPARQAMALDVGLRAAAGEPTAQNRLFADAVPLGIQLSPNYGQTVTLPPRADVQGYVNWIASN
ncbi:MAG: substrate-binding domain-containing protein [Chloroflexi bacterium]|nr:substrate-binding domain-containing protein [Chloroflexota bacterium]